MKRSIYALACLTLMCTCHLTATDFMSMSYTSENHDMITTKKPGPSSKTGSIKRVISSIPHVTLNIQMDERTEMLKVEISGEDRSQLEWVIFQPKGEVISRITTNSKINEIKMDHFKPGDYVLMIKDELGRAIFRPFKKS